MKNCNRTTIAILSVLPIFLACAGNPNLRETEISGTVRATAIPEEFLDSQSNTEQPIDFEEWIIFEFNGSPSGMSSDGKPGSVGLTANELEITISTGGISVAQILDRVVAETSLHSGLQGFPDYSTGRVLILSSELVTTKGIHSRDSGIDMGFTCSDC